MSEENIVFKKALKDLIEKRSIENRKNKKRRIIILLKVGGIVFILALLQLFSYYSSHGDDVINLLILWRDFAFVLLVMFIIVVVTMHVQRIYYRYRPYLDFNKVSQVILSSSKKNMKNIISISILIIAISLVYFFAYLPYSEGVVTKKCHGIASEKATTYSGNINKKNYDKEFEWCMNEYGK